MYKENGACTRGEISSRLSLIYTAMATNADQWKWRHRRTSAVSKMYHIVRFRMIDNMKKTNHDVVPAGVMCLLIQPNIANLRYWTRFQVQNVPCPTPTGVFFVNRAADWEWILYIRLSNWRFRLFGSVWQVWLEGHRRLGFLLRLQVRHALQSQGLHQKWPTNHRRHWQREHGIWNAQPDAEPARHSRNKCSLRLPQWVELRQELTSVKNFTG